MSLILVHGDRGWSAAAARAAKTLVRSTEKIKGAASGVRWLERAGPTRHRRACSRDLGGTLAPL
jgi:hypothetical protein